MNATAYTTAQTLIIVDCGVLFADPRLLGVNGSYHEFDELFADGHVLDAYVITHGHEDHIGALPFAYKHWPAPIYASPWTAELIKRKFDKFDRGVAPPIFVVHPGSTIAVGDIQIEYLHMHHSIPDTCALMIRSGSHRIFHTGDFKFEDDPVDGKPIDFEKLRALGREGIDVLLADSTNALSPGKSLSELEVTPHLKRIFSEAPGRVFITTFASNLWRIQSIASACKELGKRLYIAGRGIESTLDIAEKLGRFEMPRGVLVSDDEVLSIPPDRLVVIASGSQGEGRAAIAAIATGNHRIFSAEPGDTFIFSSRMIPGNEKTIFRVKSLLERSGARVVTTKEQPGIHVSGHGHREDLLRLISLLNPRTFVPIHGTYTQLLGNRNLGRAKDIEEVDPEILIENGSMIELRDHECSLIQSINFPEAFIETDSPNEVSWETLRKRLKIGELGLALVSGAVSKKTGAWVAGPEVELVGIELPLSKTEWLASVSAELKGRITPAEFPKISDLEEECRLRVRRKLESIFNRKPVVHVKFFAV
jgi:ribonuclease J